MMRLPTYENKSIMINIDVKSIKLLQHKVLNFEENVKKRFEKIIWLFNSFESANTRDKDSLKYHYTRDNERK